MTKSPAYHLPVDSHCTIIAVQHITHGAIQWCMHIYDGRSVGKGACTPEFGMYQEPSRMRKLLSPRRLCSHAGVTKEAALLLLPEDMLALMRRDRLCSALLNAPILAG